MTRHYLYGQTKCATCKGGGTIGVWLYARLSSGPFTSNKGKPHRTITCPDCNGTGYTTTTVLLDGGNLRLVHDDDA